jgi:hypothetical protein
MITTATLERAAREAGGAAVAVREAVYRGRGGIDPGLRDLATAARRWGEWVERALAVGEVDAVSDACARRMAIALATGLHAQFHRAFDAGGGAATPDGAAALLNTAERAYVTALAATRHAAQAGLPTIELRRLWAALSEPATHPVSAVCAAVGALGPGDRAAGGLGLRASLLARRTAMLGAGVVDLHRRMLRPRLARGLAGIASRRATLWRARPEVRVARSSLTGTRPLDRVEIVGRVRATGWVDRPEVPYSFARCDDFEVRVHRRNLVAIGVGVGRHLWVRGKVETGGEIPLVVAEFEGPGTHAGAIWEDWMADESRGAYDLWPQVIDLVGEFPRIGARGGMSDLAARSGRAFADA